MYGLPFDASVHGHEIDRLIAFVHVLMLVLFVGWGAFYLYTLARFRESKNPKADYVGVKGHASSYLEVTVAVVEVVLLVGFSIPIYGRVANQLPAESESVVVRVVAQQFNWNFHYAGPDGKFGKMDPKLVDVAMNPYGFDKNDPAAQDDFVAMEMHVPVGKPVIARVTSRDVIHSFGVPNLRVKIDAIPGMEVPTWFTAKLPGQYDIACSQLCGDLHYSMMGMIHAESAAQFDQWLAAQTPAVADII